MFQHLPTTAGCTSAVCSFQITYVCWRDDCFKKNSEFGKNQVFHWPVLYGFSEHTTLLRSCFPWEKPAVFQSQTDSSLSHHASMIPIVLIAKQRKPFIYQHISFGYSNKEEKENKTPIALTCQRICAWLRHHKRLFPKPSSLCLKTIFSFAFPFLWPASHLLVFHSELLPFHDTTHGLKN